MLRPKARWKVEEIDRSKAETIAAELQIPQLVAELLVLRGIENTEEAARFLRPDASQFYDPMQLKGMDEAVHRIRHAISTKEKIRIYGDYDADGVSSTALMIQLLRRLDANFDYYIPNRASEGYGLHKEALELAQQEGVTLLITVDNGISAVEQVSYAKQLGIDIIVTDHHEPPDILPDAYTIINPKVPDCSYPFKALAGVGVALKLAQALVEEVPLEWLELAAIGTIADLMPLVDENRLIVQIGLSQMKNSANPGIRALLANAGIVDKEVTCTHIGFALAPRINASGRLDSAEQAVRLLVTSDLEVAAELADTLDRLNKERQAIVEAIFREALRVMEQSNLSEDEVIVVMGSDWNVGVIGIVASRLLDQYYRPVIVLSVDSETGQAKGSARSIPGFDIYEALTACADLLVHFGGHQSAAGMTLELEAVPALRTRLCELARNQLSKEDYIPMLQADIECGVHEVNLELIEHIERLAPFGMGNPAPRFIFSQMNIHEMRTMGKDDRHLKLVVGSHEHDSAVKLEAVGFDKGEFIDRISATADVEVLGEVGINEWNGLRRPQIIMQDLRIMKPQVYDWRGSGERRMRDWLERNGRTGPTAAILIHDEKELQLLPEAAIQSDCAIWLADNGTMQPLNSAAERSGWAEVEDLLLLTLPPSLQAIKLALASCSRLERTYACLIVPQDQQFTVPSREGFKQIYGVLRNHPDWVANDASVWKAFSRRSGLSEQAIRFIIDVFIELGFVEHKAQSIRCAAAPQKQDLASSRLYVNHLARQEAEAVLLYSTAKELTAFILEQLPKGNSFEQRKKDDPILEGII